MFVRRLIAAVAVTAATAATAVVLAPPASATGAWAVDEARLPDGQVSVLRWNGCQHITYKLNLDALPQAWRNQASYDVKTALQDLANATGFTFDYRGDTSVVPQPGDGPQQSAELVIAYVAPWQTGYDLSGMSLGEGDHTYYTWSRRTSSGGTTWQSAITRGSVVIDAGDVQSLRPGFGPGMTSGNLLLHELGHVVGIDHVDDYSQLMAPHLTPSAPDGYGSGDLAALYRVSTAYGCIAVPSSVSPDLS